MKIHNETCKRIYAIVVAAGKGTRMGSDTPKQLMKYNGRTILEETVDRFYRNCNVDCVIVVSPADGSLDSIYSEMMNSMACAADKKILICNGGAERGDSVFRGLEMALKDSEYHGVEPEKAAVMIHDAARPGVDDGIIQRNLEALAECDGIVTAIPSVDSVRYIGKPSEISDKNFTDKRLYSLKDSIDYPIINSNVVERSLIYNVQTPQTFRIIDIYNAYLKARADGYAGTDDASIAEYAGVQVAIVEGTPANRKITTIEDLPMTTRVGTGYDVHRLVPGRDLILCGTPVPCEVGLLGHSDADVAAHALMDALLGAAGLGDIGRHFPDTDIRYKGANSMSLLADVRDMLADYRIVNVDVTIIAEAPKLAPYNERMRANVARVLEIPETSVNIKATTTEGLGFTGRKEGIAAIATCAIEGSK